MNFKKNTLFKIIVVLTFGFIAHTYGDKEIKTKLSPTCKIDLNNDKVDDFLFLVYGWKAFVLLTTKNKNYKLHFINYGNINKTDVFLSCVKGKYITETTAGSAKGRKIKVPTGTYFEIAEAECCSTAYYWKNNKFEKVATSD